MSKEMEERANILETKRRCLLKKRRDHLFLQTTHVHAHTLFSAFFSFSFYSLSLTKFPLNLTLFLFDFLFSQRKTEEESINEVAFYTPDCSILGPRMIFNASGPLEVMVD